MQKKTEINIKKTLENISEVNSDDSLNNGKSYNIVPKIKNYFLTPMVSGLIGFAAFFTIIIATEFFAYLFGSYENFSVDIDEVVLSSIGFICFFLIAVIKALTKKNI